MEGGNEFATFVSAIEKPPSSKKKNLTLHHGNDFIKVYKTFFDNHYAQRFKDILLVSM